MKAVWRIATKRADVESPIGAGVRSKKASLLLWAEGQLSGASGAFRNERERSAGKERRRVALIP
jgi:hypothetical protein